MTMQDGERFNTISHLIATVAAIFGVSLLMFFAFNEKNYVKLGAFAVYAISTVGLYLASTLYHGSQGEIKKRLHRMDHIGIYFKIAGNMTPFLILLIRGVSGWSVLAAIWTLAFIGVCHEFKWGQKTRTYAMTIYTVMTLAILPVLKGLYDVLPPTGFCLIMLGYVSYSIGFYFYLNDTRIKHGHGFWHIGVIGGTFFQYLCLLLFVA